MHKRHLLIISALFLLGFCSSAYAIPDKNSYTDIDVWPRFWQWESPWGENPNNLYAGAATYKDGKLAGKFMKDHGCRVTAFAMLFRYHGLKWIPDENHYPTINPACEGKPLDQYYCNIYWYLYKRTNPGTLNKWLTDNKIYRENKVKKTDGTTYIEHNLYPPDMLSKFYLHSFHPLSMTSNLTLSVEPNYSCTPVSNKTNCDSVDWSDPNAEKLLDHDLEDGRPDIMKIKWSGPDRNGIIQPHESHFVLIGGYSWEDNSYRAYDPNQWYSPWKDYPPGLNTLYAKKDNKTYTSLRIDRYKPNYLIFPGIPDQSRLGCWGFSPIEMQIISPDGNITGYDPVTGERVADIPSASYSEESEPSIKADDTGVEPAKVLFINKPTAGNYILKIFGTGDGPYTIKMEGVRTDGTTNLDTTITGTATPSLQETYRVIYSPTGEAILSNTNQAPIANAGADQTGEQGYEITLDGSGSNDPDGDPIKYTWSFVSRPDGSAASLSDANTAKPMFIPDRAGTYVLQLVVTDYFADTSLSTDTITITATQVETKVSVTPNLSAGLAEGPNTISFTLNNIGRVSVYSGNLEVRLKDPDGIVLFTESRSFTLPKGSTAAVDIPVNMPPVKLGNYTLVFRQSDESKQGELATAVISSTAMITSSFDRPSYKVRETANLTVNLANIGKFALENAALTVSAPDARYYATRTISLSPASSQQSIFTFAIPGTINAGQHTVNVTLTHPSGGVIEQSSSFAVPESELALEYIGVSTVTAGDIITLIVENKGGADAGYSTDELTITDTHGIKIYQGNLAGSIQSGEKKFPTIQIPSQAATGGVILYVKLRDTTTGKVLSFYKEFNVNALDALLSARTDKDVYLSTERITAFATLTNNSVGLSNGVLDIKVKRARRFYEDFTTFLPIEGWTSFDNPQAVAIGPDGSMYVADTDNHRIQKFDSDGKFLTKWDSKGSGDGQFLYPYGISVGQDGLIYVADTGNSRIQKFDGNGNFIAAWGGSYCRVDTNWDYIPDQACEGQFAWPESVAVDSDGSVYVVDSGNYRIQKFDGNGNFLAAWGSYGDGDGQFKNPSGIAVGPDSTLYVADTANHRVQKFDGNGNFIMKWGSYGWGDGQFRQPSGLAVSGGFVYVADTENYRIQEFDSNGTFIMKWGSYGIGDGQFKRPGGVAAGPDGLLYVADFWNDRIQKFDSNGRFLAKWGSYGSGDGWFNHPTGVAIAPDSSVYVVDSDNHRIQKFDSKGNFILKWGSYGGGNGQFNSPRGIAVAPDGSMYVADTQNHRIQKFDSNGAFITKWGSIGSGNGQFRYPSGIAVGPDGSVYVMDTNNSRIQKFDSNGNFITKWGSYGSGDGQFRYPSGIAVGPDGSVYVADTWVWGIARIQRFDINGNYIRGWDGGWTYKYPGAIAAGPDGSVYLSARVPWPWPWGSAYILKLDSNLRLGSYSGGDGEFQPVLGIAIAPNGSVYVADTGNHRIQKMVVSSSGTETLFEATVPITQSANTTQDYTTAIGNLNVTGKLYLEATLKNSLGQTIATSEYPFYVVSGNTLLIFNTDKKTYQPGETVTITGEVKNLASVDANGLNLKVLSQRSDGITQTIYTNTFTLSANSSYSFTFTTTASSEGIYTLIGKVTHNNVTVAEVAERHEVATPKLTAIISSPDVVGKNPFNLYVEVKNTGKVDVRGRLSVSSGWWNPIDNQPITIPAGETRLMQYSQQIAANTAYTVNISGDVNQSATKTVIYGEAATIQFGVTPSLHPSPAKGGGGFSGSGLGVKPEGKIEIPVTITNTGLLDEALTVNFSLQPLALIESGNYFLPRGGSVTDTLYYNLTEGSYQLSAVSALPYAAANTSFSVAKENKVAMTNTVGSQGTNGLIPVTVNLTNNGYNEINGSINLAVMNNQGKAVWRGETQVSGLKSKTSMTYPINVDPAGIISGAYKTDIVLYSTSGQQLAENQAQIRVSGPIFEVTSVPAYPTFTVGRQAEFTFTLKNTGTQTGTTNFAVKAMDVLSQSVTDTLNPGEEKSHTFNFTVPEEAEEKDYLADYALVPVLSQATNGQAKFHVARVNVKADASLDKTAYRNGDTAVLTLTVSKLSQFEDGNYIAIIRYGAHHDMQIFTLTNQPATLIFSVPLPEITGENLFYSIHFESGRDIYRNTIFINKAQPDLIVESLSVSQSSVRTYRIEAVVTNQGELASEASAIAFYDGDPSISTGDSPNSTALQAGKLGTVPLPALSPGQSITVNLNWDVIGRAGKHAIYAVADPNNSVIERIEVNNTQTVDVTLPELAMSISTTKPQYEANRDVGIAETVVNLTAGTTYSDAVLTITIKDPAVSTIATLTNTIPAITPGEASYANSWNTSSNRPGNYSVESALTHGGTSLASASTTFEILPTVSAYGDMTSPSEVIQGFPLDISYNITNNGNVDISQAEVKVEVEDKARGGRTALAVDTLDYLAVLATKGGSIAIEKVNMEPGEYTLSLILTAGDKTIIIASKDLTVKPPLKVTKAVSTLPRALVLLDQKGDEEDDEDKGSKGKEQETDLNQVIITNALNSMGVYYRIITGKKAFKQEMRSGIYNTYVFAGKESLEDHLDEEIVERINSGDGLILLNYEKMEDEKFRGLVGAKSEGHLSDKQRTLAIIENPMTPQGALSIAGKVEKFKNLSTTVNIAATVQEKDKTYPGILINPYGKGRVIIFTFDMAKSAKDRGDTTPYSSLLRDAIAYGVPDYVEPVPDTPLGVEITLKSLGQAFDLKVEEKLSAELPILLTYPPAAINEQTITWEFSLPANETRNNVYFVKVPEDGGSHTAVTEVSYLRSGSYEPYDRYSLTIEAEGLHDIQMRILSGLESISESKAQEISQDYQELLNKIAPNMDKKGIEKAIHDLIEIIEELGDIKADTKDIRLYLDNLMKALERRWVVAR